MFYFFIQARTGSTRLPNKVLLPFHNNKSILDIIVKKLKISFEEIPIVICTSNKMEDNDIESFCSSNSVECFRGDEKNVLKRFVAAASVYQAENIIRICADNPFLDMIFLKELISEFKRKEGLDYLSFATSTGIPVIKTHFGFFAEIVTKRALEKTHNLTQDPFFLEHVTNYIYSNSLFNCEYLPLPSEIQNRNDLRFTIDNQSDFQLLSSIYSIYELNSYDLKKTIDHVDANSSILDVMKENILKFSK